MACARVAIERCGFDVDKYYASEVDKYAIQVAKANYPDIVHIGDVREVRGDLYQNIDLLCGGSPCQGFSFAGKQLNFDDPRSALFFEFVRVLKECRPKYFLLENVRMKKEYQDVITEHLGVEPIMINSSLVSAQNRVRLYWTNIPNIRQPDDRGIVLRDILENNEVADLVINQGKETYRSNIEKSHCLMARDYKGFGNQSMTGVREKSDKPMQVGNASDINGHDMIKRIYSPDGKSPTLTSMQGGNTEPKVAIGAAGLHFSHGLESGRRLKDGKNLSRNYSEGSRVYKTSGKAATLTAQSKGGKGGHSGLYRNEFFYRKLTPLECERLQTLPDNYTEGVSNTQRYKMIGNGWTVDVIAWILKNLD